MKTFDYFAYGSNMLSERLKTRCPSAKLLGQAHVQNFHLAFSKKSIDLSGKATLMAASGNTVHGVVFRIPLSECDALDRAEGKGDGYERNDSFSVTCPAAGIKLITTAYIAGQSACDESLLPYDWYRDLVLAGAFQNKLPVSYITTLRTFRARPDPKLDRPRRLEALDVLKQAGFGNGIPLNYGSEITRARLPAPDRGRRKDRPRPRCRPKA